MKILPGVRLNFSRSGGSVSFGVRGLHYTVGPRGTRTTVGVPGTGISWTEYQRYGARASSSPQNPDSNTATIPDDATSFESAGIDELAAASTSELAPILDARRKQYPLHLLVPAIAFGIFALALAYNVGVIELSALVITIVVWPIAFAIDRRRRTTTLNYDLQGNQKDKFDKLLSAFTALQSCHRIWRIPVEWNQSDWKRNAGAGVTVQRQAISPRMGLPSLLKCNLKFPSFLLGKQTIYFAPDAILIVERNSVAALNYLDADIVASTTRFIEDGRAPGDAQVVGETWRYVNKKGGPDRRFSNNSKLPICLYGQLDFKWSGGLNAKLHCSRTDVATEFSTSLAAMREPNSTSVVDYTQATATPTIATNDVAAAFAAETPCAKTLAVEHGKLWEFLLVGELLNSRISVFKVRCDDLQAVKPAMSYGSQDFINWIIQEMGNNLSVAMDAMTRSVTQDLPTALGKPGIAGDAIKILQTVNALFYAAQTLLTFERKVREARPPQSLEIVRDSLKGIASSIAIDLERFVQDWDSAVEGIRQGSKEFSVKAVISAPPQLAKFSTEVQRITNSLRQ